MSTAPPPLPLGALSTLSALPQIIASSALCSLAIIEFTVPQIVRLSAATAQPLPSMPMLPARAAIHARAIAPQTAITTVQFAMVRELRDALDASFGKRRIHLSLAYGAASVPLVAAKYNLLASDVYAYAREVPGSASASASAPAPSAGGGATAAASFSSAPLQALARVWRQKIAPGLLWSYLRDSGSIGGSIVLGPIVSQRVAEMLATKGGDDGSCGGTRGGVSTDSGQGGGGGDGGGGGGPVGGGGRGGGGVRNGSSSGGDDGPGPVLRFGSGLATGCFCGLVTQLFHNAALTGGRISELEGRLPSNAECMRRLVAEHGLKAFYLNFRYRVGVIAGWSAVLNVLSPFG